MTTPTSVCVGAGLTTDGDGRLVVDACTNGGLCFDTLTECIKVCTQTLHSATLTHSGNLTVPASAGATNAAVLVIPYNVVVDQVGGIATPPSITIAQSGRYLLSIAQGDSNSTGNSGASALHTVSAELLVNGVQQLVNRLPRLAQQTHVPAATKAMNLVAGDVITGRYTIHNDSGATVPLTLNPAAFNILQVQQLPALAVIPA
jgi:hypothetical protein